ncbi:MAG: nickel pincer cofactor biosynthesis protein LarC [Acetatifactor sp.]
MRTLYIECNMGAAGDMLTAALLELLPEKDAFLEEINHIGIPGVEVTAKKDEKCGIRGTHIHVKVHGEEETEEMFEHHHDHCQEHDHDHCHDHEHDHCHDHDHDLHHEHHHHHAGMDEICQLIGKINVSDKVKQDVRAVYETIAEAESHAHGRPVEEIHFHEVGSMDAVTDVTAVSLLLEKLAPEQILVSPIHVGSGQVRCAHGILPVPAPATAHILRGVPIYGGEVRGELCTPTGAALLKYFATRFCSMPVMRTEKVGIGTGRKDFEAANCVRIFLGETEEAAEQLVEMNCNLDDCTAERIAFATEQLLAQGALDVYTVPAGMKKSRPGILLCVLCREADREKMAGSIFRNTSTLGIRVKPIQRYTLDRTVETVSTALGPVRKKISAGFGIRREKWEYEDLAKFAREKDLSIEQVIKIIEREEK